MNVTAIESNVDSVEIVYKIKNATAIVLSSIMFKVYDSFNLETQLKIIPAKNKRF